MVKKVQALLEAGPLVLAVASRIVEHVAGALAAAHRAGVVHRDLKPGNILLDEDGNAYLADFGIAKNLSTPNFEDQTQADVIVGSPAYISPEQIRSEFVRPQTDIYALGVMLYELLTGTTPFAKETLNQATFDEMRRIIREIEPPRPSQRVSTLKAQAREAFNQANAHRDANRFDEAVTQYRFAEKLCRKTPILIMHGAADARVSLR